MASLSIRFSPRLSTMTVLIATSSFLAAAGITTSIDNLGFGTGFTFNLAKSADDIYIKLRHKKVLFCLIIFRKIYL